ncbi:MAG: carboxypeptidase-like regulatory domain-containing protein [Pyrinomonadaceae bacterium]|nr:carboxypeptidase-like regulatory domain-containing protein [Pyrinomonadaceae bacterium]
MKVAQGNIVSSDQHRWITFFALVIITVASWTLVLAQGTHPKTSDDPTETPKSGSITGRVLNESGQPLANAAVFVRAYGSLGQVNGTATDDEGNFRVGGLDPVAYQIWAGVPAYIVPPRDPDSTTPAPFNRVGDSVDLVLVRGGVITGTVTTSSGEPVVAVSVAAHMLRDGNGQPPRYGSTFRAQSTDDRGIYRIYGLASGTYIVAAGGQRSFTSFTADAYESHAPTYAPSSTRDNAAETIVRAGEETTSVDIRYRGEPGHVVSGFANDPNTAASPNGFNIRLTSVHGDSQSTQLSYQPPGSRGFVVSGIADGDYLITAETFSPGGDMAISEPRRIKVRGADVTGVELVIRPLGSISGRVALEESKVPGCKGKRRPLFGETLVSAWHNENEAAKDQPQFLWSMGTPIIPDKQGDFLLRNLAPGQYRFNPRFFAKYWYLQSISLPSSATGVRTTPSNRPTDAARNWTRIKAGERVPGLTIILAEGAASLQGQIKTAENQKLPARLFVYLVPAEREQAEDVLRFFAALVSSDGSFALNNLPPGRYWANARPAGENVQSKLRLPDQVESRAKLRQEIEATKTEIELQPCQNVTNYALQLKAP